MNICPKLFCLWKSDIEVTQQIPQIVSDGSGRLVTFNLRTKKVSFFQISIISSILRLVIIINVSSSFLVSIVIIIKVTVLVEDINFANGLELDPSENFLLFCETGMARVHKQVFSNS